jgi:hypothetical protein
LPSVATLGITLRSRRRRPTKDMNMARLSSK